MSKTFSLLLVAMALVFSGCELLITEPPVDEAYYFVSYHGNGSDSGTPPSDYFYYQWGDPVGVQGNTGDLSRVGYTFAGWNTSPSSMGATYLPGQSFAMPANDVDLYAIWAQNLRAIHFEANGGSGTMVDQTVAEGVPTVLSPVAFTRPGYLFSGWNTTAAGTGTGYTDQATVIVGNQGLTLYAIWTPSSNSVSFQANGGTGTMAAISTTPGTWIQLPASDFTRTGYTFSAWNTEADGTGTTYWNSGWLLPSSTSVILYAQWTAVSTAIHFDGNGGDGSMAPVWGDYGTTVQLPLADYGRAGYSFAGWSTTSNGDGESYSDGATVTFGAVDITLYAQWSPLLHSITFVAPGASGTMAAVNVPFGTDYTLPAVSFTKTGHHFTEWSEQPSGGSSTYTDQQTLTMPDRSLVLYAQWAPNSYTVTFHANGGTGSMPVQSFTYGVVEPLNANQFSNGGLLFAGWSETPGGTAIWSDEEGYNTGPSDRDLYALWSNSVSIEWGSGSTLTFTPSSATVSMGQSIVLEAIVAGAGNWRWYVDNVRVPNQSTGTFEFEPSTHGFHTVSVLVTANGMTLSGNIIVRVNQ